MSPKTKLLPNRVIYLIILTVFAFLWGGFQQCHAKDVPLFYRGDFDNYKTTAPNGAIVHKDYADFLFSGDYHGAKVIEVTKGVWTITGYSISNFTFIETETGLVALDTGNNIGSGREALKMIRKYSSKPIIAVIYSHHHYTGGTTEYLKEAAGEIKVIGHPALDDNLQSTVGALGPMQFRRIGIQFGFYLPKEGEDAALVPQEPLFDDPKLNLSGHVPVNTPVKDGQSINIDGMDFTFYHAASDTRDSLVIHVPKLDMVLHNAAVTPVAFPLYTLRGTFYRDPVEMISSVDKIRELDPQYLIGCHGLPTLNKNETRDLTLAHRDYISFVYNQSIRALNKGMTPEEIVNTIRLPEHLVNHKSLIPAYIDYEYAFRAQYRGLVGWYAEDPADLHPPTTQELGQVFIELAGGMDKVVTKAQEAFDQKKYNLTAKLLSYVLAVDPEYLTAKKLKAQALRSMAQATVSGIQTRNYLLTNALHLEGKLDITKPPKHSLFAKPSLDGVMKKAAGSYVKLLETKIDPVKSADVQGIVLIAFHDMDVKWAVHVRRGVAEVSSNIPKAVDGTLSMTRKTWAEIQMGITDFDRAISEGAIKIEGDKEKVSAVLNSFG
ncbi:Alkyl sulfatase BDS1, metallo-beta-lactamase superfamily [Desulfocicer vacuolatum DSM 3385]|uniref:Alkyl sulfatase BDS1, metallo-beta-lactamase superfamily n=1 Tax=Desulfocicer vacuolatum DSM 3385 TaxID=1121400 RepID=A0A1W2D5Z7_9BACT|nr:alkyl sulfatase dimerization domain-containing protein [Desulfocicer vacuolatum]SMC92584.1 Alkyl sulfatase BDS1, metallo-beta-lactamase superfamily [Desulfocicer vacuolatum DSM 3385]